MLAAARRAAPPPCMNPTATGRRLRKQWREHWHRRRRCRTQPDSGVGVSAGSVRHRRRQAAALLAAWRGRIGHLCQQMLLEPLTRQVSVNLRKPQLPTSPLCFPVNRTAVVRVQRASADLEQLESGGGRNWSIPLAPMRRPLSLVALRHCCFLRLHNRGCLQLCRVAVTVINVGLPDDEDDDKDSHNAATLTAQPAVKFLRLKPLLPVSKDSLKPVVCEMRIAELTGVAWRFANVVAVGLLYAAAKYTDEYRRELGTARPSKCLRRRCPPLQRWRWRQRSGLPERRRPRCGDNCSADVDREAGNQETSAISQQPLPSAQFDQSIAASKDGTKASVGTAFAQGGGSSLDSAVSGLFICQSVKNRGARNGVRENIEYDEASNGDQRDKVKEIATEDEAFSKLSVGEVTFFPTNPQQPHAQPLQVHSSLPHTLECVDLTRGSFARTRTSSRSVVSAGQRFIRRLIGHHS